MGVQEMETKRKQFSVLKWILLSLLLCSMVVVSVACDNKTPDTEPGTDTTAPEGDLIDLSGYTIVIPLEQTKSVTIASNDLQKALKTTCSVDIAIKKDSDLKEGGKEILIGETGRAASKELFSSLGEKEYAVVFDGDQILLL